MKAALIGCGAIARQHLACLQTLPGVEIAAVCDRSPATAEAAAERHGARTWYTDHVAMLTAVRPDVVHVTTPPTSHARLCADALDAGAHVIVEKPATPTLAELRALLTTAELRQRHLIEDYNYIFNAAPQAMLTRVAAGDFGRIVHVDVSIALDIFGPDGFADPNVRHPALDLAGGAVADFLPHLASLAHAFVGPARTSKSLWSKRRPSPLPYDEFRGLIQAERGTATVSFSANAQPDGFWLRIQGERMSAAANLFETRLTTDGPRAVPKPLRPFINGFAEARTIRRAAVSTLLRKFNSAGAYEGLWTCLARTYGALANGTPLPISARDVLEINEMIEALKPEAVSA